MTFDEFRGDIIAWDRPALDNYIVCAESHIVELRRKIEAVQHEISYRDSKEKHR